MADQTTGPEGPVGEGVSSPQLPESNTAPVTAIEASASAAPVVQSPAPQALAPRAPPPPPPPPTPPPDEEDEEEEGMLRMSFMDHLEELRTRILRALIGVVVAFVAALAFADPLWRIVSAPAVGALTHLGIHPPNLAQLTPMEGFNVIYIKLPLLVSIFVGSPWILYQVWAFISPGLYKREKRWATPFILSTAGLFIAGGLFAYYVAFRYGLEFLLGLGLNINVTPVVSINEYFDLFVNVTLGVGLVFEMPVIIFFLTLLRMASPRFLLKHSRYAILVITILAAIVTPTPDVFNMMIFAVPMVALYFVGLLASYLLVLKREGRRFPWGILALSVVGLIIVAAAMVAVMIFYYHFHFIHKWPFLTK
jgi:sec-independent protein translocase protein TatC